MRLLFPSLSGKTFIRTEVLSESKKASFRMFPSLSGKTFIRTRKIEKFLQDDLWEFPSLSGKTFIRTRAQNSGCNTSCCTGFHPFQGRPSFGRCSYGRIQKVAPDKFPSLSGKTFIRTSENSSIYAGRRRRFPSLSGKTFIRTSFCVLYGKYDPTAVSIPFREDLHSDSSAAKALSRQAKNCFHPFQGRPSFGQLATRISDRKIRFEFPSLSGKTFIRTCYSASK